MLYATKYIALWNVSLSWTACWVGSIAVQVLVVDSKIKSSVLLLGQVTIAKFKWLLAWPVHVSMLFIQATIQNASGTMQDQSTE